jgi:uncharacterized membrane protein YeaQ/YmgE (transglycosylase-associated protein family)
MAIEALIIWLIVGGVAGWLASLVMTGGGFGLIGNIVLGIVGAFIGHHLLPAFGSGVLAVIVSAFIGSCIVLFLARLIKRAVF